ncbi:MAG: malonyl-CoA decarboxylase [Xanthobacteraceae bacterium]
MNTSFFGELLQTIADRGRALVDRRRNRYENAAQRSETLIELCDHLLSGRGEASGVALAREILERYSELTVGPRIAFFESLVTRFGPDRSRIDAAIEAWRATPSDATASDLHGAAEPRRLELLRRLNLAPGGTAALVSMREQLLDALGRREDLAGLDADFVHLFTSWFNRGFLVMQRIDWSTPASILEKIMRYEAVHEINDWNDLRRRINPRDRRCYAFFHPALVDEPLIFVEVALMPAIPASIGAVLDPKREPSDPTTATTAAFYSISNCQRGLAGVSFGHFLIKQVVEEVSREFPKLTNFVTLSPVPRFAEWLRRERANEHSALSAADRTAFEALDKPEWWHDATAIAALMEPIQRAAANYFLHARLRARMPYDPVARFHLGNGASLERLNWPADLSDRGVKQAYGLMVNYRYDLGEIEQNHEAFAEHRTIVAAPAIVKLARNMELVAVNK